MKAVQVSRFGGPEVLEAVEIDPQDLVFPVPDGVPDEVALALVLQGTTAWHLLRTSTRVAPGESVVVHAA
ncbi:MAG TPA: hypothetical protein VE781_12335, partial [Kineosporiaceae bacterium]|nr:hypothetical protein [Kineosporiaceae bacterium]